MTSKRAAASWIRRWATAPSARGRRQQARDLEVTAPSLDGLTVTLPAPKPVTEQALLELLQEQLYAAALRLPRVARRRSKRTTSCVLDVVAYCDGQIVPFMVLEGLKLDPLHDQALPGLREQLVGARGRHDGARRTWRFPRRTLFPAFAASAR